MPTVEELLALDLLTLRKHTELAGDVLEPDAQRHAIERCLAVSELASVRRGITSLRSNVYKTNRLSMAFHRRLGFKVTRENAKGVKFTASLADLAATPSLRPNLSRSAR